MELENKGLASYLDRMRASDGAAIRYGVWRSDRGVARGTVVLLSGRNEFLEKYAETIGDLCARGWDVFSLDWRGQGLSTRMLPNRQKGYIMDYEFYIGDLGRFLRKVVYPNAVPPVTSLAFSMGAHILLRYIARHAEGFSRVALISPMIDINTGLFPVTLARQWTRLAVRSGGAGVYAPGQGDYRPPTPSSFFGNPLTADAERYKRPHRIIARNPDLALGGVTYGWLRATFDSIDRMAAPGFAASISTPILIVSSGDDRVVSVSAQVSLHRALPRCRFVLIPGARHELLMEQDRFRAVFWRAFDGFMSDLSVERRWVGRRHSAPMASRASQRS